MKHMLKNISLLLLLPALSACLIVEQYGSKWDEANFDPCLLPIVERFSEWEIEKDTAESQLRWLSIGEDAGLMLLKENADDEGGHAYVYGMDGKVITVFTPDPSKRKVFETEYPNPPVAVEEDTVTITELSDEVISFIGTLAKQEDYWLVKDSRLYNTARNEACPQYIFTEDDD